MAVTSRRSACCGSLCWDGLVHIDVSNAVAVKRQPSITLRMKLGNRNKRHNIESRAILG
jgi:hypothetical protein